MASPQYPSFNDREFDLEKKIANNTALLADAEAGDVATISGTPNEVSVSSPTGNVTIGLPSVVYGPSSLGIGVSTAPVVALEVSSASTASPRGIMSSQYTADALGARVGFRKARGTRAAPSVITTGDNVGRLNAWGYDGSDFLEEASIIFSTEGTIAATRVPGNIGFWTATNATPSVLTQRLVIDSSGNFTASNGAWLLNGATGGMPGAGVINAKGFQIDGVAVATSTDTYWNINALTLWYTAAGVNLTGNGAAAAGALIANSVTAASATNLTLNGGSSGASLALGQGGAVKAFTFTAPATSLASWTTTGAFTSHPAQTFTDTSTAGSGTAASAVFHSFAIPTLAATNASVTTTTTATVYIAGAPTAGTNQTIPDPLAFWVGAGTSRFSGRVRLGTTNGSTAYGLNAGYASLAAVNGGYGSVGSNFYTSNAATYKYFASDTASRILFNNGGWEFDTAISGTADGTISWVNKAVLSAAGDLNIKGTTASTSTTTGSLINAGGFGNAGAMSIGGKITTYNNAATAGNGLVSIQGAGRATGQTAANASVATYTVGASDASFTVSANVLVTTSSAEAFTVTCAYTDEGNTARTITLNFQLLAGTIGTSIAFANGAVPYEGIPVHIRAKAATAITVKTAAGGTYTGATYNVEGVISKLQ